MKDARAGLIMVAQAPTAILLPRDACAIVPALQFWGDSMRNRALIFTGVIVLVTAASMPRASAAWGCGVMTPQGPGSSWGAVSRERAYANAMGACMRVRARRLCRLISCSPDVDTEAQADVLWPPVTNTNMRYCGRPGEPSCSR